MREIKFRAWDKENNVMLSNQDLDNYDKDGVMHLYDILKDQEKEGVELMQYTGLKDKNGKEIYEGDIVNYHQFLFDGVEHEETGKGIIKRGEYGWLLSNIIHDGISEYMGYSNQDQLDGKVETYLINVYGLHEESFEVIGNIYENPELLKND